MKNFIKFIRTLYFILTKVSIDYDEKLNVLYVDVDANLSIDASKGRLTFVNTSREQINKVIFYRTTSRGREEDRQPERADELQLQA